MVKRGLSRAYLIVLLIFLYLPILLLVISSFNSSPRNKAIWGGFSLRGYTQLFRNEIIMHAMGTTILLAVGAAGIATVLGTMVCLGMIGMRKRSKALLLGMANIPLLNADIVTGIALMLLFSRFVKLSFGTMLIAHVTLIIPYVVLSVQPKVVRLNLSMYEAALDLGASPVYALWKVILPEIRPGIEAGFLLAFTMSLDDFSVTYFTKAPGIHTMSTMVNAEYRRGIQTEIYALSTIIFLIVLIVLFLINRRSVGRSGREMRRRSGRREGGKIALSVTLACLLAVGSLLTGCSRETGSEGEIVVFNYGDYLDVDVLSQFEKETGITVRYEEFLTPEAMYTKYKNGTINYDLICCSDYMLDKMIQEKELREIDFGSMEHIDNIGEEYFEMSRAFDPERRYTIPNYWGTVGILYNQKMVDGVPDSWSDLWDEKYRGNIIMQDSVRDSFIPALKRLGYSINTTDEGELHEAQKLLLEQKELVQSYLVDEVRDDMANEQAALAVIYSGEASLATEYNEDLAFVVPKEGSDIWMDSWAIPRSGKNYDGAMKFLDFLCREDVATKNFEYVYYSTPNEAVLRHIDEEEKAEDPAIFPSQDELDRCEIFRYLGRDAEEFYNYMWKEIKAY